MINDDNLLTDDGDVNQDVLMQSELLKQLRYQRYLNQVFGIILHIVFFTVVFLRAILVRIPRRSFPRQLVRKLSERFRRPQHYPRCHVKPYRLRGKYDITIPTFPQAVAIGSFTVAVFVCSVLGYNLRDGESTFVPDAVQWSRYIATRAGVMSFALFPLLILTVGRINLLVGLTRWSYNSWNVFHRWIGRLCLVCVLVHGFMYMIYAYMLNRLWTNFTRLYWDCGFLGVFLMLILSTVPSARFARKLSYEVFLVGHVISTAVLILVLFYHTLWERAEGWLYLTLFYWAIEHISRVFKTTSLLPIEGELSDFGSVLRLDVFLPKGSEVTVRPGAFAYLRFPDLRYIESHPFSIADVREQKRHHTGDSPECTPLVTLEDTMPAELRLSFLIRPHEGMTRSLHSFTSELPLGLQQRRPIRVYLEGPYGYEHDLTKYTSVVLLAGGVGVTFTLPYWSRHRTENMRFVWVVRSLDELSSVQDLFDQVDDVPGTMQIFYTGKESGELEVLGTSFSGAEVTIGRPHLSDIMGGALKETDSLAILACGPGEMLDGCRSDVEQLRSVAGGSIDYFEEATTA